MHLKVPAGFGGRLRGKGPGSAFVNPGPRRAAHPVHESLTTTRVYLHADMALKEQALSRLAPDWGAPKLPDNPSNRMDVWKGEVIASTEEELLTGIQG